MNKYLEQCPVCGMSVSGEAPAMKYHKMTFQFCSLQCKETFMLNPKLYSSGFRASRKEIIKKRTLCLEKTCDTTDKQKIEELLLTVMGIRNVSLEGLILAIDYDLMQTSLSQINKLLADKHIQLSRAWLQSMKYSWENYKEKNELENMKRGSGACCNRPPPKS